MKNKKISTEPLIHNSVNTISTNVVIGDVLVPKPEHVNKFKKGTKYVVKKSDIDAGNPTITEYWMKESDSNNNSI